MPSKGAKRNFRDSGIWGNLFGLLLLVTPSLLQGELLSNLVYGFFSEVKRQLLFDPQFFLFFLYTRLELLREIFVLY